MATVEEALQNAVMLRHGIPCTHNDASAIIRMLNEAGLKVLPREPTEAMGKHAQKLINGRACYKHWRAMWDAAS